MDAFLEFLANNYILFLVIAILLIFSLIGYVVDLKRSKNDDYRIKQSEEINLENIEIKEDMALNEMVNKNKTSSEKVESLDIPSNGE